MTEVQAGWYPDPAARFELRYHNGSAWTADVSNDGDRFVDPLGTQPNRPAHGGHPVPGNTPPSGASNRAATASMVLGIVAVGIGWLPFVFAIGVVAAVLAIVFGLIARRRSRTAGPQHGVGGAKATAGLILGPVGLLVCVGGLIFSIAMVRAIDRFENPPAHDASITTCERSGDDVTAAGELTNTGDDTATYTVRVHWVRTGTDNPRRQANVVLRDVRPDETRSFEASRSVRLDDVDCIVGGVRGELPFGVDPGG